jgi:hypothetical protein
MSDTQYNNAMPCPQCCYADCRILFTIMLRVIMLNVIMLSVVMLNVVMLTVVASFHNILELYGYYLKKIGQCFSKYLVTMLPSIFSLV